MIACPECHALKTQVVDSRENGYRRRMCPSCGKRFTTVETIAPEPEPVYHDPANTGDYIAWLMRVKYSKKSTKANRRNQDVYTSA